MMLTGFGCTDHVSVRLHWSAVIYSMYDNVALAHTLYGMLFCRRPAVVALSQVIPVSEGKCDVLSLAIVPPYNGEAAQAEIEKDSRERHHVWGLVYIQRLT
jgi:hypothetical protein